jgi:peroxiredoxin
MKKILSFMCVCVALPLIAAAQQPFQVKGKLSKPADVEKAFLVYNIRGEQKTDSALVVKGAFQFAGTIEEPTMARLAFLHKQKETKNRDMTIFYLEKGTIVVEAADSTVTAKILSPVNNDFSKLKSQLKPVSDQKAALMNEFQTATAEQKQDEAFMQKIEARYEELSQQEKAVLKSYLSQNTSSIVSLEALKQIAGYVPDVTEVEPLYTSLSTTVKNTKSGQEFGAKLTKWKSVAIGAISPDFSQNDTKGNPVKLASFRGKYLLIDFWASWCGPCRRENPVVVEAYNEFKDKNFTIMGISLDNNQANWEKAIEADKLEWTQLSDLKGWQNEVAALYGVQSIPQNFLLDPDGKIIAKNLRGNELKAKLKELLGSKE